MSGGRESGRGEVDPGAIGGGVEERETRFPSGAEECAASLVWPPAADGGAGAQEVRDARPVACVVMAHGFGATRRGGLVPFARAFAAAGFAVLMFDYRHFGDSDGSPRQLVDVSRQLEDWHAAVAYARSLAKVDPERVVLWGTSFSGGHVIAVASDDHRIAAVVSQVPHASGLATALRVPPRTALRQFASVAVDLLRAARGREPFYIPIVAPPGRLAAMTSSDALHGYAAMFAGEPWENRIAARSLLEVVRHSPTRQARRVAAPVLVQVARHDRVTPPSAARRMAQRLPNALLREYDCGHFDAYNGKWHERFLADQLEFLAPLARRRSTVSANRRP
ncbi:alpha/beta fold hydrolase [Thermoleophilum album]|jgi:pimeloyl-ACP methyl ester carboxylesterase|uniref:alpha/beta hydrolase n=1 Tax=Thermoleophilum album TaxID=29539 RepID=UPI00237CAA03|nr:alpha/beta fold hydrolase [Thermoleophilum album]WDT93872.1 alpha/beta fold hydrolase [Thermoleophilum album]